MKGGWIGRLELAAHAALWILSAAMVWVALS